MISNHIIKEDKIILYFDYSFEIGSFNDNKQKSLLKRIYDYLKNIKGNLGGKKILLMVGSTLVATLIYTGTGFKLDSIEQTSNIEPIIQSVEIVNNDNLKEEVEFKEETPTIKQDEEKEISKLQEEQIFKEKVTKPVIKKEEPIKEEVSKTPITKQEETKKEEIQNLIKVYRSNGAVLEIELEEYIVGVVAAEMPAAFQPEALKAQSVLARTYALKHIEKGEKLTDTEATQSYIDKSQMQVKWGSDYSKYYNKIVSAVQSTKGEYLTYDGDYIEAVYHSTSNGYTEDAFNVWGRSFPYLKSVESSWDRSASSYVRITTKEPDTVLKTLGITIDEEPLINITSRNISGRVSEITVGSKTYTGLEFRNLLGLRSTDFDIELKDGSLTIITRGYGHGVGMSQYGANGMANEGYNYKQIIDHYYSGVKLTK